MRSITAEAGAPGAMGRICQAVGAHFGASAVWVYARNDARLTLVATHPVLTEGTSLQESEVRAQAALRALTPLAGATAREVLMRDLLFVERVADLALPGAGSLPAGSSQGEAGGPAVAPASIDDPQTLALYVVPIPATQGSEPCAALVIARPALADASLESDLAGAALALSTYSPAFGAEAPAATPLGAAGVDDAAWRARFAGLKRALTGATLLADRTGRITRFEQGAGRIIPCRSVGAGALAFDLVSAQFAERHEIAMRRALAGEPASCYLHVNTGAAGASPIIVEERLAPVLDDSGGLIEVVGYTREVTEELAQAQRIRELLDTDRVTGAYTIGTWRSHVAAELGYAQRGDYPLACFAIELDTIGASSHLVSQHAQDDIQRLIVARIQRCLPDMHVLGRRGERSFIVACRLDRGSGAAQRVAEHLVSELREPIVSGRSEHFASVAVGVAIAEAGGLEVERLLSNADVAALTAQRGSRNRAVAYDETLASDAFERGRIEAMLSRGLERDEFRLAFQPKVRLSDGEVCGAEALLRWVGPHPMSPADFVPIAEECGLIGSIGQWVLKCAAQTAARWAAEGRPIPISVNVSTRQFHDNDFHHHVREILSQTQCDPALIELEVTEGAMFNDQSAAIRSFAILREMGVALSIDDFGMGFSSLSYLKKLPVSSLKIDRTFIDGLPNDGDDAAITRAIIAMAGAMNKKVVAEGAERAETIRFLSDERCDQVQGYFFSKPLFEPEFQRWMSGYRPVARH